MHAQRGSWSGRDRRQKLLLKMKDAKQHVGSLDVQIKNPKMEQSTGTKY